MTEDARVAVDANADLLVEVEQLIGELQQDHGPTVAVKVTQLLQNIDAVHRAGLTHLLRAIRSMAGDAFINRLIADPAIRILLMSYDLIAADRRLSAEEALDAVRGHLHGHGIDVEILDVVGGVVYVRLHGSSADISEAAVIHDLEEALRAGFIGFQELVTSDPRANASPLIPIDGLRRAHRPVYRELFDAATLQDGEMQACEIDGQPVLVVRVNGDYLAVANRCGESPLPLEFSELEGAELRCSWHGCRYDLRTGTRLDRDGDRLPVYPVRLEKGVVAIAVGVEPASGGAE